MPLRTFISTLACLMLFSVCAKAEDQPSSNSAASRSFAIDYNFQIIDLPADANLKVWCPVPSNTPHQKIELSATSDWKLGREPKYGNQIAFAQRTTSGKPQPFQLQYNVVRSEALVPEPNPKKLSDRSEDRSVWLKANSLVPLTGTHLRLLSEMNPASDSFEESKQLYNLVLNHVDYRKDQPGWGRGDAVWVCDSKFGNCTDFHSLFISLSRVRRVPAKFEIGFSIPTNGTGGDLTGYHCWAWFHDDQRGWVPVDISEADKHPEKAEYFFGNLTADRVALSTGRDLVLEPPQAADPLNYFIAPYAEVNGKAVPKSQIKMSHTWKEIESE